MTRTTWAALSVMSAAFIAGHACADGMRDPTRPPMPQAAHAVVHESLPELSAVFISGERRKAVVDGRLVQKGDALNAGTIESVSADRVVWRRAGVAHELLLQRSPADVKKPTTRPARKDNGAP